MSELRAAEAALAPCPRARLLAHRWRTPYAEIDLLIDDGHGRLQMIEVKSRGDGALLDGRISLRQKEKLAGARLFVESRYSRLVRLDLALVGVRGEVVWIPDFLC